MSNGKLILMRHGESEWNASNQFTGWQDVNLTDKGRAEAKRAGELLRENELLPDVLYTSLMRRAIITAIHSKTPLDAMMLTMIIIPISSASTFRSILPSIPVTGATPQNAISPAPRIAATDFSTFSEAMKI